MATATAPGRAVSLEDRYNLEEGTILATGVQALVRVILDQMRGDAATGRNTGALVSGYQGSPLGGFDLELARQSKICEDVGVVHRPAVNEELGATAVWGSQLVPSLPEAQVDGVLGVWYGKAPGVDRAADALRHGNMVGAHPLGGMLAVCGDDAQCKSSTIPSASEATLAALKMPVVAPGTPQEVLDLGLHAIAMSRASGTWVGMKIATNVADAISTVTVGPGRIAPVPPADSDGQDYVHAPAANLGAPPSIEMERTLAGPRRALVEAYARANGLNRTVVDPTEATIGLVAAGSTYYDLREALLSLGLDDERLHDLGIRILQIGLLWPLEPDAVRTFARGLREIVVIEEKGPFLETLIREVLYDGPDRPRVLGKRADDGSDLLPAHGTLPPDAIASALDTRLPPAGRNRPATAKADPAARALPVLPLAQAPARVPFFCSGCPHNRSTEVPDGATVGAGIGCHTMIVVSPTPKGNVTGVVQMGGEGAQWIGQAPFLGDPHLFQNLGDGTFFHSGSLAVRAAVAAGVNITYKLLYNDAVAMTGGQPVQGTRSVADLTRLLEAEGVRRIVVTAEDLSRYRGVRLARIAELRPRSELIKAQEELQAEPGVTMLIHDQACAAELRRLRKRGQAPEPTQRAVINERVCEGCGDCGQVSHCLSVVPVETEFGTKTSIHQSSCNTDYSCLEGDCPSFLMVTPGTAPEQEVPAAPADLSPPPRRNTRDDITLRLMGIGGTGVVTIAQVLGMAAMLDGKRTLGLDQTGLAQKGGPVVSDVRILAGDEDRSVRPPDGGVDAYLGFDLLGALNPVNLAGADPDRTVAVVSTSEIPTASMVGDPDAQFADPVQSIATINATTNANDNIFVDAREVAERLFGDHLAANTLLIGAAWQRGLVPLSLDSIHEAFRLNGAAVDMNLAAFAWGRALVDRPEAVATAGSDLPEVERQLSPREAGVLESIGADADSELQSLLEVRIPDLVDYQGMRYANRYADLVRDVLDAERAAGGPGEATCAVARQLHKLMAYKDEYEVARLHLDPREQARIEAEFGVGARVHYQLQPPLMRAMGMRRKISLGGWFRVVFRILRTLRVVRGTPLDIFGYHPVRRTERALIEEYTSLVTTTLPLLNTAYDKLVELYDLPDMIRGYEGVKLRNVARYRERVVELRASLEDPTSS